MQGITQEEQDAAESKLNYIRGKNSTASKTMRLLTRESIVKEIKEMKDHLPWNSKLHVKEYRALLPTHDKFKEWAALQEDTIKQRFPYTAVNESIFNSGIPKVQFTSANTLAKSIDDRGSLYLFTGPNKSCGVRTTETIDQG